MCEEVAKIDPECLSIKVTDNFSAFGEVCRCW